MKPTAYMEFCDSALIIKNFEEKLAAQYTKRIEEYFFMGVLPSFAVAVDYKKHFGVLDFEKFSKELRTLGYSLLPIKKSMMKEQARPGKYVIQKRGVRGGIY